jgi:hypothetical protein
LRAAFVLLALGGALAGCGSTPRGATTVPSVTAPTATAPAIAAAPVVAAARGFVRGYLAFQAGALAPAAIPHASVLLRRALAGTRIPPAQRSRRATIESVHVDRADQRSAHVTVQVLNRDESLAYPVPLDLVRARGRWIVSAAGDDE